MDFDHSSSSFIDQDGQRPPLPPGNIDLPPLPLDEVPHTPSSYLPADELVCEFIHNSMVTKQGVMINFINHNCPDSATIIGGIRLRSDEIARIPAIIARHFHSIKLQAAHFLQKHFDHTQSALGLTETITVDDFSLSFMLASVSDLGRSLHPYGRNEGPLHFCLFPKLCKLIPIGVTHEGEIVDCHVINAYVHLNDPARRKNPVLKKKEEDRKRKKEQPEVAKPTQDSMAKKQKFQPKKPSTPEISTTDIKDIRNTVHQLAKEVKQLNLPVPPYPALPATSVKWPPVNDEPPLPEDL